MALYSVEEALNALKTYQDVYPLKFKVRDKLNLLLTYKGVRKAGILFVTYSIEYKGTVGAENKTAIEIMKRILEGLSIPYSTDDILFNDNPTGLVEKCIRFYYGPAHKQIHLLTYSSKRQSKVEIGRLLAYPETAIQAFLVKECLRRGEFPWEITDTPLDIFLCFMPSRAHWREEMQTLQQQVNLVLEDAPWLWEQGLEAYQYRKKHFS